MRDCAVDQGRLLFPNSELVESRSFKSHALKVKDVSSRYGRISNEEFVRAIDQLTFEHGETEIVREDTAYETKCAQNVYKTQVG
jgi:hypothetical protein